MTSSHQSLRIGTNRAVGALSVALRALETAVGLTAGVVTPLMGRRRETRPTQQLPPGSSHFDRFLQEATTAEDRPDSSLGGESLFGLYTSWCFLNQTAPRPEGFFWAAMSQRHIRPGLNGLRMEGAATANYILASSPGLV